jgi:predicted signal transduction protein with EAL and GGDEF domain
LLIRVARLLEQCLRTDDIVARLGGDEFTILLSQIHSDVEAMQVAERIHDVLRTPINIDGVDVYITASMGITIGTDAYETAEEVLRDADTAMYEAKQRGRARHVLFQREMQARVVRLLGLQTELREALRRSEFRIRFQPIVSLDAGRVCGFEALVRWEHPKRGLLYPSDFIQEAESIGLIVDIDLWILSQACRQLSIWQTECYAPDLTISVNVSSKLFAHERLIGDIREILSSTNLPPRCLKLEITETVLMAHIETASNNISLLRELGVELSIDDFGTGYSSLSYLTRFPLTMLKVDRSFVELIGSDVRSDEIAQTIMTLARNLGLDAVAEGIETLDQLARLKLMGCGFGQGFLFSAAVQADVAREFISRSFPVAPPAASSAITSRVRPPAY